MLHAASLIGDIVTVAIIAMEHPMHAVNKLCGNAVDIYPKAT
jgi:hypothetical protein